MSLCSNGTHSHTGLEPGQLWKKGNRERIIVDFDETYMFFQTKKDVINKSCTGVFRNSFREWLDGAVLQVKGDEKMDKTSESLDRAKAYWNYRNSTNDNMVSDVKWLIEQVETGNQLELENKQLRESLEFYANKQNYSLRGYLEPHVIHDGGDKARTVLEETK